MNGTGAISEFDLLGCKPDELTALAFFSCAISEESLDLLVATDDNFSLSGSWPSPRANVRSGALFPPHDKSAKRKRCADNFKSGRLERISVENFIFILSSSSWTAKFFPTWLVRVFSNNLEDILILKRFGHLAVTCTLGKTITWEVLLKFKEGIFMSKTEQFASEMVCAFQRGEISREEVSRLLETTPRNVSRISRRVKVKGM